MDRVNREKEHFDRLALDKGMVWWGNETEAGKFRLIRRAKLAIKFTEIKPHLKILEIGCGKGDFTQYLAMETKALITAVDISSQLIKIAKDKIKFPNIVFEIADIEKLPFGDEYFDAVVGVSVLHHLNFKKAFPEIKRVLKQEGRLFFSEPNMLNPQVMIERKIRFIGRLLQNSPDETAFFRWQIASFLSRQGFSEIKIIPFDFLHPSTPSFLIKNVSRLSMFLEKVPLIREFAGSLIIYAK